MKNKALVKIIAALSVAVFVLGGTVSAAGEQKKNETIYVSLNADGSVDKTTVVNSFELAGGGTIYDFGEYSNLKNLTDDAAVENKNGSVTIKSSGRDGMFYYQGDIENRQLPWTFEISYLLDGKKVPASDLVDASGKTVIELNARANENVDEYFKKCMTLQISVELPMDACKNIAASGATSVVAGDKDNISLSVLPGTDATLKCSFDAQNFTLPSIQMNMMQASLPDIEGTDDLKDGLSDLEGGMNDLIGGSRDLRDGLADVADGSRDVADGAADAAGSRSELMGGLSALHSALDGMNAGTPSLKNGAASLAAGLSDLNGSMGTLTQGYAQSKQGLDSILQNKDSLTALATGLLAVHPDPADPVNQLATAMLQTLGGVETVDTGMAGLNAGLGQAAGAVSSLSAGAGGLASGVNDLAGGIGTMAGNFGQVESGAGSLFNGLDELKSGAAGLASGAAKLPGGMDDLIDGERDVNDGILDLDDGLFEALDKLKGEDLEPVSFVAPGQVKPASVQFILTTPAQEEPAAPETEPQQTTEETFWDKLINLFK